MDDMQPSRLAEQLQGIGLSQPYASQLANRKRTPSLTLAVKIKKHLGIPEDFWVDEPEPARQN